MATNAWTTGGVDTNWSTAGNWSLGHKPAAGEDVTMGDVSDQNCVINEATAALNSFDCTGYTGTLSGTSNITVTVASGTSTVLFAGTSPTWSGTLLLNPAAGTTINLTFGSLTTAGTCGGITIAGTTTGMVNMLDGITIGTTKVVTLTSGTLHTDGASDNSGLTHSWGSFNGNNSNVKSLYLGTSNITITGTGGSMWIIAEYEGNSNFYCGTSTITFTGAVVTMAHYMLHEADATLYNVAFNCATSVNMVNIYRTGANGLTFNNLTITGPASKTFYSTVSSNLLVNGALTFTGNSAINRILVPSSALGTAKTIALGASATFATNSSNFDLRDITMTGGAANELVCSSVTGGSGDCGGNTGITFTTADDWFWNGSGTRNFSDYTYWYDTTNGGGTQMASTRCPLPQDTCYINGDSIDGATTIDQDLPRIPGIDCTGAAAFNLHLNNIAQTFYGSLTLTTDVTMPSGFATTFEGRGNYTITCAGGSIGAATFQMVGGAIEFQDNFGCLGLVSLKNGTLDFVTNAVTFTGTTFDLNFGNTRRLDMGGDWTLAGVGNVWNLGTAAVATLTFNKGTANIICSYTGATASAFNGGGLTYNNITIAGGTNVFTFGNFDCTFGTITLSPRTDAGTRTVKFTSGTTTTVNSLVATGTGANHIALQAVTAGTIATISDANGGTNVNDYLDVQDIVATQTNTFYYGANGSADAESTNWLSVPGGVTVVFRPNHLTMMGCG